MRTTIAVTAVIAALSGPLAAQESKPVPKDSMRVFVPGCARGSMFTAGRRTVETPGSLEITEGMRLRMNGPKKVMTEIKAHEGSMIEITGLMKKGQYKPDGVGIGGGVRIGPAPGPSGGSMPGAPSVQQIFIDVEGWRPVAGDCPSR
jgi:hypothetical protein